MKKAFAAFLSTILGVFGLAAVDKTIEGRVAALEAQVSSLQAVVDYVPETMTTLDTTIVTTTRPLTTTATTATTISPTDWHDYGGANYCPRYAFIGDVRICYTQMQYRQTQFIPKSNDPQTPEECEDRYIYEIRVVGSVSTAYAGYALGFTYRSEEGRTENATVPIGSDGSFTISVNSFGSTYIYGVNSITAG